MIHLHTILHPTDFSRTAEQALHLARSLARDHGAKLVLAAVPPAPPVVSEQVLPDTEYQEIIDSTQRDVSALAATITEVPVETVVKMGSPGSAIVGIAQDVQADLVVLGTHGRTGLTRLLMGSVAEYVVRYATCPVLTVKAGTAGHWEFDPEVAEAHTA